MDGLSLSVASVECERTFLDIVAVILYQVGEWVSD